MTAEVCVMNSYRLALAADRAVTIGGGVSKIYTSADMLFQRLESSPLGIMIFQVAEIMGLSWETVIKVFRTKNAGKTFDTVEECTDANNSCCDL